MKSSIRTLMALLAVLALALGAAACGDDDEGSGGSGGGDETRRRRPSREQGHPEGRRQRGQDVHRRLEELRRAVHPRRDLRAVARGGRLHGQEAARPRLRAGRLQGAQGRRPSTRYPEYTGTALTSFYKVKTDDVPRDPQESFDQLKTELEADKITALPQTPFQNTYKITSTKETAEKLGNPKTITELAEKAGSKMSISGFPECRQRTDCLLGLKNVYDWTPKFVSSQGQYDDLDQGQADFTFGFSTDGPLSTDKYVTYEDDKKLFPPYYVTFMVGEKGIEALGDSGQEVIAKVQEPLTEEVMQELNSRVTLDKQEPEAVAARLPQGSRASSSRPAHGLHHRRAARRGSSPGPRAAAGGGARGVPPRARRLARHAPGPGARGDARRRDVHGRRPALHHRPRRRAVDAQPRRRRARPPPRAVRAPVPPRCGALALHGAGRVGGRRAARRPRAAGRRRPAGRARRAAGRRRGRRRARPRPRARRRGARLVRGDRRRGDGGDRRRAAARLRAPRLRGAAGGDRRRAARARSRPTRSPRTPPSCCSAASRRPRA